MRHRTTAAFVLACILLASAIVFAGDVQDPWRGKHVDEVTAILGPPNKVKESAGVRTLSYKLMLPGDTPPLDPQIRLLQLPGVGLVAQFIHQDTKGADAAEFEPTHVSEDGRVVAGGYNTESSANVSFDPKTGKVERDWSVSPKKYMKKD